MITHFVSGDGPCSERYGHGDSGLSYGDGWGCSDTGEADGNGWDDISSYGCGEFDSDGEGGGESYFQAAYEL